MLFRTGIALALVSASCSAQTTVTVSSTPSHPIPTALWGIMYEDISWSGDGGLYAELLQNRAFQKVTPGTTAALSAWTSIGSANLTVIADPTPVSDALPNALQVVIPTSVSTAAGVANTGYAGLNVSSGTTYHASFYYRFPASTSFSGDITVSLQSTSGSVLASSPVTVSGDTTSWTQASVELKPERDGDGTSNVFAVTVNGEEVAGETIHFAMFSLFPPTYKDRQNGMRKDIAEALEALGPSFFRFPGGNNLEGETVAQRWQWNATLGDLIDRPGRLGDWRYINTDGLGIYEYLVWCEDIKAEPIMAVWAGYALQHETIAEANLGPYIQQAIDQIYFVVGDPETNEHAARRAALGHPDPFYLKYVEIGNEDFVAAAATTYPYRWKAIVSALKTEFPDLYFIATTFPFNPILDPEPTVYDNHLYESTTWMAQNTFYYDDYERNGTQYFEGEYATTMPSNSTSRLSYPTVESAITDAAFMTGFERNADIVFAAAYAPVLMHIQNQRWHPNMINFDAGAMYLSPAYYTQLLFSLNRGTDYIPSTLPDRNGTLFWTVVQNTATTPTQLIIKVVNTAVDTSADVTFVLPFGNASSEGTVQILTGPQLAMNNPTTPNAVPPPVKSAISTGSTFTYSATALSLSVITLTI